jgi:hypothetical protein
MKNVCIRRYVIVIIKPTGHRVLLLSNRNIMLILIFCFLFLVIGFIVHYSRTLLTIISIFRRFYYRDRADVS